MASEVELIKIDVVSLQEYEVEWDEIFVGIWEAVDIVVFQDGYVDYYQLADYFVVNKWFVDCYGLCCWINVEFFDWDMFIKFLFIKWEKLCFKLEVVCVVGLEKVIIFEFLYFMSL